MGGRQSKTARAKASDIIFSVEYNGDVVSMRISAKHQSLSLQRAVLEPWAAHSHGRKGKGKNVGEIMGVEIDGQPADPSAPVSSFASPSSSSVVVKITWAPESCAFLVSIAGSMLQTKLTRQHALEKLERCLIKYAIEAHNRQSPGAPIGVRDVASVCIDDEPVDTARLAASFFVPPASQPVTVKVNLSGVRGWTGEELASPMETALSDLRGAMATLREGGSPGAALGALESAMRLLEKDASTLWQVDVEAALKLREKRRGPAKTSLAEDSEAVRDGATARWLTYLVGAIDKSRPVDPSNTSFSDSHVSDSSSPGLRASKFKDTSHEAQSMLLELSWDWDVDVFDELSSGCSLSRLFLSLLDSEGLVSALGLSRAKASRYIAEVESRYGDNAYHSRLHGADVLLGMHLFLRDFGFAAMLTPLERLAALFAAALHDFQHPGTLNAHEIKAGTKLALRYNDMSVLENFHCASAFELLVEPHNNFLSGLSTKEFGEFRRIVVKTILATDLRQHFDILSQLKSTQPWTNTTGLTDKPLVLATAIKFADIGHTTKPWTQHERWSRRITDEMLLLGDHERSIGLAISPLCDRNSEVDSNLAENQINFLNFICFPFYKAACRVVPGADSRLRCLEANYNEWRRRAAEARGDKVAVPPAAAPAAAPAEADTGTGDEKNEGKTEGVRQ